MLIYAIAIPLFNIDIFNIQYALKDFNNPDNLSFIKFIQISSSVATFVIPPFIIAYFINKKPLNYLLLNKNIQIHVSIIVIFIMFALLPIINFTTTLNQRVLELPEFLTGIEDRIKETEEMAQQLMMTLLKADNSKTLLLNLFMIAIIPAIGEELFFRGIIEIII